MGVGVEGGVTVRVGVTVGSSDRGRIRRCELGDLGSYSRDLGDLRGWNGDLGDHRVMFPTSVIVESSL